MDEVNKNSQTPLHGQKVENEKLHVSEIAMPEKGISKAEQDEAVQSYLRAQNEEYLIDTSSTRRKMIEFIKGIKPGDVEAEEAYGRASYEYEEMSTSLLCDKLIEFVNDMGNLNAVAAAEACKNLTENQAMIKKRMQGFVDQVRKKDFPEGSFPLFASSDDMSFPEFCDRFVQLVESQKEVQIEYRSRVNQLEESDISSYQAMKRLDMLFFNYKIPEVNAKGEKLSIKERVVEIARRLNDLKKKLVGDQKSAIDVARKVASVCDDIGIETVDVKGEPLSTRDRASLIVFKFRNLVAGIDGLKSDLRESVLKNEELVTSTELSKIAHEVCDILMIVDQCAEVTGLKLSSRTRLCLLREKLAWLDANELLDDIKFLDPNVGPDKVLQVKARLIKLLSIKAAEKEKEKVKDREKETLAAKEKLESLKAFQGCPGDPAESKSVEPELELSPGLYMPPEEKDDCKNSEKQSIVPEGLSNGDTFQVPAGDYVAPNSKDDDRLEKEKLGTEGLSDEDGNEARGKYPEEIFFIKESSGGVTVVDTESGSKFFLRLMDTLDVRDPDSPEAKYTLSVIFSRVTNVVHDGCGLLRPIGYDNTVRASVTTFDARRHNLEYELIDAMNYRLLKHGSSRNLLTPLETQRVLDAIRRFQAYNGSRL